MILLLASSAVVALVAWVCHQRTTKRIRLDSDRVRNQLATAHSHLRDYDRQLAAYAVEGYDTQALRAALVRTRARVEHARWLIFQDWGAVDIHLGLAERDISRALRDDREDILLTAEDPTPWRVEQQLLEEKQQYIRPNRSLQT